MPRCYVCGETDHTQFGRNDDKPKMLSVRCKACDRDRTRERGEYQHQINVALLKLLRSQPCSYCHQVGEEIIDFHHVEAKDFSLGSKNLGSRGRPKRFLAEVAKCVPLCANCHRRVHAGTIDIVALKRYDLTYLEELYNTVREQIQRELHESPKEGQ